MSSGSIRVAIVVDSIKRGGGAEKNAVLLANLLHQSGIAVTLVTFSRYSQEYTSSCPHVSFNESPQPSLLRKLIKAGKRIYLIKRFCVQHNVTHIVSFMSEANMYCLLSKSVLRNRAHVIVSVRANPTFFNWCTRLGIRILYRYAATVVSVSGATTSILQRTFGLSRLVTIYNPVDQDYILQRAKDSLPEQYQHLVTQPTVPTFVTIGRLTEQKGHQVLLRAFARVQHITPAARLIIIGEGVEQERLQQLVNDLGISDHVVFAGTHDNVYPFLRAANCFVLSSYYEGFPNVLLEAAALGLYIVSTDCATGPREIVAPELGAQTVAYPYRVPGASLIQDFNDPNAEPIADLCEEMIYAAAHWDKQERTVSVTPFTQARFLAQWKDLL